MKAFNVTFFCERFCFSRNSSAFNSHAFGHCLILSGKKVSAPPPHSPPQVWRCPYPYAFIFMTKFVSRRTFFSSLNRAEINFLYELDTKFFTLGWIFRVFLNRVLTSSCSNWIVFISCRRVSERAQNALSEQVGKTPAVTMSYAWITSQNGKNF